MSDHRIDDKTLDAIIESGLRVYDDCGVNLVALDLRDARAEIKALREREQAIEQARKDEREACADAVGMAMMPKTLASDPKVWKARDAALAAIRARGER